MIDAVEEIIDENPRPSPSAIIVLVSIRHDKIHSFLSNNQLITILLYLLLCVRV